MSSNLELAYELKAEVSNWVRSEFNQIQLEVFEHMAEKEGYCSLNDLIDFPSFDVYDEDERAEAISFLEEEGYDVGEDPSECTIEDYLCECRDSHYPMWCTLFECRDGGVDATAAREAGFTVINAFGPFEQTLAVAGAGYSFYGRHWIPLWLSMPWNSKGREKYDGVRYGMV